MRRSIGFFSVMLVLALLVVPACFFGPTEPGGGGGGTVAIVNVAGTWDVVFTVTGGTQAPADTEFSATFTLAQSGRQVTGTIAREGGLSGQLTGTIPVASGIFTFSVEQGEPCPGTFNGSVTDLFTSSIDSSSMSGSYSGVDCSGTLESTFVATRP